MKRRGTRKCVGCGAERPKIDMLRVARSPDGRILIDASGRVQGRGAYVCRDAACLEKARKKNAFARVLKHPVVCAFYKEVETYLAGETDDA